MQIVGDVIALLRPRAVEKQLRLETRLRGQIPAEIRSDPTRLLQILVNLTGNAIKFTEHGGITCASSCPATEYGHARPDVVDRGGRSGRADAILKPAQAAVARDAGGTVGLTIRASSAACSAVT
jgi:signal transduction histidine kinase